MSQWVTALVVERVPKGDDIVALTIRTEEDWPSPAIGSHVKVRVPSADQSERLYTICNVPSNGDGYQLAIRRVRNGLTSGYLWDEAVPGNVLHISRPIPGFDFDAVSGVPVALIAGGIGITPFRGFVASYQPTAEGRVRLVYVVRSLSSGIFLEELEVQSRRCRWLDVDVFLTRDDSPPTGGIHERFRIHKSRPTTQAFVEILAADPPAQVYYSGPAALGEQTYEAAQCAGVSPANFHWEQPRLLPAANESAPPRMALLNGSLSFLIQPDQTLLEAALEANIDAIRHSCRVGLCQACKVLVVKGSVNCVGIPTLSEAERAAGYHLACCSVPESDLQLESL